jgi:hypothetical protein
MKTDTPTIKIHGANSVERFLQPSMWVSVSGSTRRQIAQAHQAVIDLKKALANPKSLGKSGTQTVSRLRSILGRLQSDECSNVIDSSDYTEFQSALAELLQSFHFHPSLKRVKFELSEAEWSWYLSDIFQIRSSSEASDWDHLLIEDRIRGDVIRAFLDDYLLKAIRKFCGDDGSEFLPPGWQIETLGMTNKARLLAGISEFQKKRPSKSGYRRIFLKFLESSDCIRLIKAGELNKAPVDDLIKSLTATAKDQNSKNTRFRTLLALAVSPEVLKKIARIGKHEGGFNPY